MPERQFSSRRAFAALKLPPGRHRLSREHVAESQRWRLLAATAELLAEEGCRNLTSHGIARRASVSSQAFYVYFGDLDDCLLASFEAVAGSLQLSAARGCDAADAPGTPTIAGAMGEVVALIAGDPPLARLLSLEARAFAPALAKAFARLVEELAGGLEHATSVGVPLRARLLVRAVLGVLSDASPADLAAPSELADQLTMLVSKCGAPNT